MALNRIDPTTLNKKKTSQILKRNKVNLQFHVFVKKSRGVCAGQFIQWEKTTPKHAEDDCLVNVIDGQGVSTRIINSAGHFSFSFLIVPPSLLN